VQIDNTIIAGNRIGTSENNVYAAIAAGNVDGSSTTQKTITGAGNLVYQGTTPLNPSKSLIAFSNAPIVADPLLAALADNGGPTNDAAANRQPGHRRSQQCLRQRRHQQHRPAQPAASESDGRAVRHRRGRSAGGAELRLTVTVQGAGSVSASGTQPAAARSGQHRRLHQRGRRELLGFVRRQYRNHLDRNAAATERIQRDLRRRVRGSARQSAASHRNAVRRGNVFGEHRAGRREHVDGHRQRRPATLASAACDAGAHTCPTLRDAINTALSGDTIVFDPALDNTTILLARYTNCLTRTETLDATCLPGDWGANPVTQFGPSAFFIGGSKTLTIDGSAGLSRGVTIARCTDATACYGGGTVPDFRLFDVETGSGLTLRGLRLSQGHATGGNGTYFGGGALGAGGAIFNQGTLTLERSTLDGNTAQGGNGGSNGNGSGGGVGQDAAATSAGGPNAPGGFGGGSGSGTAAGFGGGGTNGFAGGFGGGGGGCVKPPRPIGREVLAVALAKAAAPPWACKAALAAAVPAWAEPSSTTPAA
jgi:hypothetical protein